VTNTVIGRGDTLAMVVSLLLEAETVADEKQRAFLRVLADDAVKQWRRMPGAGRLADAAPDLAEALLYIVRWNATDWSPERARSQALTALAKAGVTP
jgi:hypothetical protein